MSSTVTDTMLGSIIGGDVRRDAPGGVLTSTNPARTAEVVAEIALGDAATFAGAARAARAAQREWAKVPAPARGRVIAQVGRLVEANKEALARLVTQEVGKPYAESLGEVQEIVDTCDFFLGEGRRLYGQTVPSEMPEKQLFTFRMPVGVAAIITAGNFPVAVPAWYLVPAILCGNAVVWKPAEYAAALGDAMVKLFHAGGVPAGVLNLVQASGEETFKGLSQALEEGLVDKVGFTGSSAVGSKVGELCGRHLQSPCLELGGKNPMVVMDDADVALAVEGALFGGFGTAGQRCTSLGTAIVHESVHDEFVRRLDERLRASAVGDPTRDVLYGPMIHERFAERFEDWLDLIEDHHTVHGSTARGRIDAANPREGFVGDPEAGLFYHPSLVVGVTAGDALYSTETFGPIVGVARFSSFDEAMELANGHGYGLSSAIYTRSGEHAFRFRERISAGMVSVNNSTSGAEAHLPFGGNGKSGNGSRQSGIWVLDQFTRWQSMNWDYAGKLQKAQMDVVELPGSPDFRI
ncbi:aldehyde dehydrogenase family protein [Candidatus Solirubrobacter pratensis]|uniref:aldehyde dehydrogenase family protein n=1 Tax=Candidatus Solirubrobacter pratensis TaxID=1298857 RepID=UPI0004886C14|nr:aldehyde dehydrogenase family protein [Candidatus Solirubrobacter pratensis]